MGTGMVPGYTWASEWCPGTHGDHNGAWAHMGTVMVPFRFPCMPGHHSGGNVLREPLRYPYEPGSIPVPMCAGHQCSAHLCPGTIPVRICAPATFRCPSVPGHHSCALVCPGTIPVPLCAQAPLRCPCVPWHHCGSQVCPGTRSVPMYARAPLRCPCALGTRAHIGTRMEPGHTCAP